MTTQQQIEFLKSFIIVWDYATEEGDGDDANIDALQKIFKEFTTKENLPGNQSADDLLYHITH